MRFFPSLPTALPSQPPIPSMTLLYDPDVFDHTSLPPPTSTSSSLDLSTPSTSQIHQLTALTFQPFSTLQNADADIPTRKAYLRHSFSTKTLRTKIDPTAGPSPSDTAYELLAFLHSGSIWDVWLARSLPDGTAVTDDDSDTGTVVMLNSDLSASAVCVEEEATVSPDSLVVLKLHRHSRLHPDNRLAKAQHEVQMYEGPLRPLWDDVVPIFHAAWTAQVSPPAIKITEPQPTPLEAPQRDRRRLPVRSAKPVEESRRHTVCFESPTLMTSSHTQPKSKQHANVPSWYQDYLGVEVSNSDTPHPKPQTYQASLGRGLPSISENRPAPLRRHSTQTELRHSSYSSTKTGTGSERKVSIHRAPDASGVLPRRLSTLLNSEAGGDASLTDIEDRVSIRLARRVSIPRAPAGGGFLPRTAKTLNSTSSRVTGQVPQSSLEKVTGSLKRSSLQDRNLKLEVDDGRKDTEHSGGVTLERLSIPARGADARQERVRGGFRTSQPNDTGAQSTRKSDRPLHRVTEADDGTLPPAEIPEQLLVMVLQFLPEEWGKHEPATVDEVQVILFSGRTQADRNSRIAQKLFKGLHQHSILHGQPTAAAVRYTFTGQPRLIDFSQSRVVEAVHPGPQLGSRPKGRTLRGSISIKQSINNLLGKPSKPVVPLPLPRDALEAWQHLPELANEADQVWKELVEKTGVARQMRERHRLEKKRGGRKLWESKVELWRGTEAPLHAIVDDEWTPDDAIRLSDMLSPISAAKARREKGKTWSGMSVLAKLGDLSLVDANISAATIRTQDNWGTASKISSILQRIQASAPYDLSGVVKKSGLSAFDASTIFSFDPDSQSALRCIIDSNGHNWLPPGRQATSPSPEPELHEPGTTGAKLIDGLPSSAETISNDSGTGLWSAGTPMRRPHLSAHARRLSLLDKRYTVHVPFRRSSLRSEISNSPTKGLVSRFCADTPSDPISSASLSESDALAVRSLSEQHMPSLAVASQLTPDLAEITTPELQIRSASLSGAAPLTAPDQPAPATNTRPLPANSTGRHWLVSPALPAPALLPEGAAPVPRPRPRHHPSHSLSLADKRQRRMRQAGELQALMLTDEGELEALLLLQRHGLPWAGLAGLGMGLGGVDERAERDYVSD